MSDEIPKGALISAASLVGGMLLPGIGGAVGAAAAVGGQAAIDKALSGPEVDLQQVKEKVERDPTLWRREGETLRAWLVRIGLSHLFDDSAHLRRLEMRSTYTDSRLSYSRKLLDRAAKLLREREEGVDIESHPAKVRVDRY